jgi:heptosyltransferase-2
MQSILLIQTAFIGDVILATALIEALHEQYPSASIDFLVRKGNEGIVLQHPYLRKVLIWDKKQGKYKNLFSLVKQIRQERYDYVVNLQRFATMGILTALSGAKQTVGFDKNPFSIFFSHRATHVLEEGKHEVDRNLDLIRSFVPTSTNKPKVYPSPADYQKVEALKVKPYICIAPTSVWFTKQYPAEKWVELIGALPTAYTIYLLGSPTDKAACEAIRQASGRLDVVNLSGELSLLASAALMKDAVMNYVNDSAPMHLASAMNAPTCAIYCSTVPSFGFGPLADRAYLVQRIEPLYCRSCGLHGHKACPEGHFRCAKEIELTQLTEVLSKEKSGKQEG